MKSELKEFYDRYYKLEAIPVTLAGEAKAADAARSAAIAGGISARNSLSAGFDGQSSNARRKQQSAHDDLDQSLRQIAQSAGAKGSIPRGQALGYGKSPDFAGTRQLDSHLGAAIDRERKLGGELQGLHQQLARESGHAQAKARDAVTAAIGGVGVLLSVIAGANILGAVVAIATAVVVHVRLTSGQSAFMDRQAAKYPGVAVNARVRGGVTRIAGGWLVLLAVALNVMVGPILSAFHPYWSAEFLWRTVPNYGDSRVGPFAVLSMVLFWGAALYGLIMVISGYRRRLGK